MSDDKPITKRATLAVGNWYQFRGYPSFIKIKAMSLPGTPSDDGGVPGIAVSWYIRSRRKRRFRYSFWYPFVTESEFWKHYLFSNAYDPETAE